MQQHDLNKLEYSLFFNYFFLHQNAALLIFHMIYRQPAGVHKQSVFSFNINNDGFAPRLPLTPGDKRQRTAARLNSLFLTRS